MDGSLATSVLALLGLFVALQVGLRVAKRLVHNPAPWYVDVLLDSPLRRMVLSGAR